MRRDWELIREILIKLEEIPEQEGKLMPGEINGYDAEIVSYHFKILYEAGLIEAEIVKALGIKPFYYAKSLTWLGHELLDSIRKITVWNKIKERIRQRGLDLTFDVLKETAKLIMMEMIK